MTKLDAVGVASGQVGGGEGLSGEALVRALEGKIPRVKTGVGYQAGLLAVTGVMLLLPLVYAAVICLVVRVVLWHLANDTVILESMGHGRGAIAALFIYLLPALVGGLLVVFMVKPFFAGRGKRAASFTLLRSQQRVLFTFVDKLAGIVGARRPCRIDVDCRVNASASFREGLRGLVAGELVLTIGLPMVGGMSAGQFAGVLAHEFGHFTQGTGMRLTYIVRSLNAWFARVVYERDAWDQWLIDAARGESHWMINLTAAIARLMVWVTRRVLWVLMWVGHFVSSFMLRQMEFDADRYEAHVAGSDVFTETCRRMAALTVAQNAAFDDLSTAWREKRLCDDLTRLVLAREGAMPAQVREVVEAHVSKGKTGWFDSHPCNADRIASAGRERAGGLFRAQAPAAALVEDFDELSRKVTELFYQENIGPAFKADYVVKTDTLVSQRGEQKTAQESLGRFFQGLVHPLRPVFPDYQVPRKPEGAADALLEARNALLQAAAEAREAAKVFEELDGKLMEMIRLHAKQRAGVGSVEAPSETRRELEAQRTQAGDKVTRVLQATMVRLELCQLLARQEAAKRRPQAEEKDAYDFADGGDAAAEAEPVALATLRRCGEKIELMRRDYYILGAVLSMCKPEGNSSELINMVLQRTRHLHELLMGVHVILREAPYPYSHAEKHVTVARFAMENMPGVQDVGGVYRGAELTLDAVYGLYVRLMSDAARRAEEVERSLGLEPLPA